MAPWLVALLVSLVISAISYFIMRSQMPSTPSVDEDLTNEVLFSAAKYGVPIPIAYGTARSGGQIIDLGDLDEAEQEEGGKKGGYTSYKYWLRSCIAITAGQSDALHWYEIGTKVNTPNWLAGSSDYQDFPTGDVVDYGRIYWGTYTQNPDPTIDAHMHTGLTPAYRCITYAAFRFYLGQYLTTPPATAFIIKRFPQPITSIPSTIGEDSNVAQMSYDLLTNGNYGLRYPINLINSTSFTNCGSILNNEGLGASITFGGESGTDLKSGIDAILDWVDGAIVDNNGLLEMKLRRQDYTIENLPLITKNDIKKGTFTLKRPGIYSTKNAINFTYKLRGRLSEDSCIVIDNSANIALTGTIRTIDYDYPIQTNKETATKVLSRQLRAASFPQAIFECELKNVTLVNSIHIFDCFRLTYPKFNITDKPFRLIKKSKQSNHTCKIEAHEEFYDMPTYIDPGDIDNPSQEEDVIEFVRDENWEYCVYETATRGVFFTVKKGSIPCPPLPAPDPLPTVLYGIDVTSSPADFILNTPGDEGVNVNTERILLNTIGYRFTIFGDWPTDGVDLTIVADIKDYPNLPLLDQTAWQNGEYAILVRENNASNCGGSFEIVYAREGINSGGLWPLQLYDIRNCIRGCEYTSIMVHTQAFWASRLTDNAKLHINPSYGSGSYQLTITPIYKLGSTIYRDISDAKIMSLNYQGL